LNQFQRQSLAGLAIGRSRESLAGQVRKMCHGRVLIDDLQDEEMPRRVRIELTLAPLESSSRQIRSTVMRSSSPARSSLTCRRAGRIVTILGLQPP